MYPTEFASYPHTLCVSYSTSWQPGMMNYSLHSKAKQLVRLAQSHFLTISSRDVGTNSRISIQNPSNRQR